MSMTDQDAAEEEYYTSLLNEFFETYGPEIASEAVGNFQQERLQSYFVAHPRVVAPAVQQLEKARALQAAGYPDAALVFAVSAVEVGLKAALLRPVVYGLVHSESAAAIIAELSLGHLGLDHFKDLLLDVLKDLLTVDLRTYTHIGGSKPLWEEIKESQGHRNAVVHRGESRSTAEADVAIRCASAITESLFGAVLGALGLHLHAGITACGGKACGGQP